MKGVSCACRSGSCARGWLVAGRILCRALPPAELPGAGCQSTTVHACPSSREPPGVARRANGSAPQQGATSCLHVNPRPQTRAPVPTIAEFLGVMTRDIRSYDSEQDIRNAWKVRVEDGGLSGGRRGVRLAARRSTGRGPASSSSRCVYYGLAHPHTLTHTHTQPPHPAPHHPAPTTPPPH